MKNIDSKTARDIALPILQENVKKELANLIEGIDTAIEHASRQGKMVFTLFDETADKFIEYNLVDEYRARGFSVSQFSSAVIIGWREI